MLRSPDLGMMLRYSQLIGRPIDNTVLSAYLTCARKGLYMAFLHRRKGGPPTPALGFGSSWHHALEAHFKSPECSRDDLIQSVELYAAEHWEDHRALDDYRTFARLMLEYRKYLKIYGLPWEEDYKTVGWPTNPMVEIAVDVSIPGARHPYAGKMDRIISKSGQLLVEDHKTTSRADSFSAYEMDNQMIGYTAIATLLTGRPVAGVRIDRLVCRKNDSEFERKVMPFTPERVQDWMRNYDLHLDRLERDLELWNKNPDIETSDGFPHNFSACHGKYGMCTYAGVCSLPAHLRKDALEDDFEVNEWNPLTTSDTDVAV